MCLFRLPPELLQQIFDEIDPSFFRKDLGRLTVCKRWFQFALPAFLRRLKLSEDAVRGLVASGVSYNALKTNVVALHIELGGYPRSSHLPRGIPLEHLQRPWNRNLCAGEPTPDSSCARSKPFVTWVETRNLDLAELGIRVVRRAPRLRTLCIRDHSVAYPGPHQEYTSERASALLRVVTLCAMAQNLTVLVLDLAGSNFSHCDSDSLGGGGLGAVGNSPSTHFCPVISSLLDRPRSRLRTLHLRLRTICAMALPASPPPRDRHTNNNNNNNNDGDDDGSDTDSSRHDYFRHQVLLNELVINLGLFTPGAPQIPCRAQSQHCWGARPSDPPFFLPFPDLHARAEAFASRMADPEPEKGSLIKKKNVVRFLTLSFPDYDTVSFDVLTRKIMRLGPGAGWGDDGEVLAGGRS